MLLQHRAGGKSPQRLAVTGSHEFVTGCRCPGRCPRYLLVWGVACGGVAVLSLSGVWCCGLWVSRSACLWSGFFWGPLYYYYFLPDISF